MSPRVGKSRRASAHPSISILKNGVSRAGNQLKTLKLSLVQCTKICLECTKDQVECTISVLLKWASGFVAVPLRSPSTCNFWGCSPMRASSKRNAPTSAAQDKSLLKKAKLPDKSKTITIDLSLEEARAVVDLACKEADDVLQSMKEPDKKPKTLKSSVREEVTLLVRKSDPGLVLQYIKNNRKEFVSGVFSSVFMSAIRKCLTKNPSPDSGATAGGQQPRVRPKHCSVENKANVKLNSKSDSKPLQKSEAKKSYDEESCSVDSGSSTSSEESGTS
jgi:hypothetical protein